MKVISFKRFSHQKRIWHTHAFEFWYRIVWITYSSLYPTFERMACKLKHFPIEGFDLQAKLWDRPQKWNRDTLYVCFLLKTCTHWEWFGDFHSRPIELPFYPWISFNWNASFHCFILILSRPSSLHSADFLKREFNEIHCLCVLLCVYAFVCEGALES